MRFHFFANIFYFANMKLQKRNFKNDYFKPDSSSQGSSRFGFLKYSNLNFLWIFEVLGDVLWAVVYEIITYHTKELNAAICYY